MKLSEINEYAQTIAGIVAIAGIVFVGVQIQQSNQFAEADFIAGFYDTQQSAVFNALDANMYATVAKSIEAPTNLTVEELLELDAYYNEKIAIIDKAFNVASVLGLLTDQRLETQLKEVTRTAKGEFPGAFGRAWVENADLPPAWPIRTALLKGLDDASTEAPTDRLTRLVDATNAEK